MCASRTYAGKLPINHPTLSPLQAPLYLLGRLPPMMLVIGSTYTFACVQSFIHARKAREAA